MVADAGGNAVDAAIAAVIVSMCTEPGIIAPGCSGFVTIWPESGEPVVIDGYAEMPGRGLPLDRFGTETRVHLDYGGGMETIIGAGSIATPGVFAALGIASELHGRLPWREVVEPAALAVEQGFTLSSASAQYLVYSHETIFGRQADSRASVHDEAGNRLDVGDVVHIPHLAATLRHIGEEGPDTFYSGDLAATIADAIQDLGGLLTRADLAEYEAVVRSPLTIPLDEWQIATNPPPAVGGATLAAILLLLDDHPFGSWTEPEIRRLVRVQRAVMQYRSGRLEPADDRVAEAARLLDLARVGDLPGIMASPSTIHTSTVDTDGTGCSITMSAGYGSGFMAPGTGMWMNNSLGEVELHPGGFHGLPPGSRLFSNMAPTIARAANGSVLSIGSPGADRITTAISSVLLNFVHLGMSLSEAITHPRVHAEVFGGQPTIAYEPGLPVAAIDDLVARRFPDLSMYFGGVSATLHDPRAGLFEAADPRRDGGTARGGSD
jgi:gamma-glutamyltranspeptidase/glutathione hydrolase